MGDFVDEMRAMTGSDRVIEHLLQHRDTILSYEHPHTIEGVTHHVETRHNVHVAIDLARESCRASSKPELEGDDEAMLWSFVVVHMPRIVGEKA